MDGRVDCDGLDNKDAAAPHTFPRPGDPTQTPPSTDRGWRAALETAQDDGPFDVVLLDVMMPDLDGPDTLRLLRDGVLQPAVPVFLTSKVGEPEETRLRSLGAAGVIAKPFDPRSRCPMSCSGS